MDKLLKFGENAMSNCNTTSSHSFEYSCFHYFSSNDFQKLCSSMLPTERMRTVKAVWPISGRVLADIVRDWLSNAVRNERKKKNHELFCRRYYGRLSDEELESETNQIVAWAIASAKDNEHDESSDEYLLLS